MDVDGDGGGGGDDDDDGVSMSHAETARLLFETCTVRHANGRGSSRTWAASTPPDSQSHPPPPLHRLSPRPPSQAMKRSMQSTLLTGRVPVSALGGAAPAAAEQRRIVVTRQPSLLARGRTLQPHQMQG